MVDVLPPTVGASGRDGSPVVANTDDDQSPQSASWLVPLPYARAWNSHVLSRVKSAIVWVVSWVSPPRSRPRCPTPGA